MHLRIRARFVLLACVSAVVMVAACEGAHDSLLDEQPGDSERGDGGTEAGVRSGASSGGASSGGASSGGASSSSSSSGAASSSGGAASSSGGGSSSSSGGPVEPTDQFAEARVRCVNKINALRATKSLTPYGTWGGVEACVDAQATSDEQNGTPHGAWSAGGVCKGNAQNECLGQGVNGIESCLDQMWAEKNLAVCTGCDACAGAYTPNCANCVFSKCGHYVNMSAQYLSEVACGFSTAGNGGWAVQNFH